MNKGVISGYVVGMKQTKTKGLLIKVHCDPAQIEAVRVEVSRSAGSKVGVRSLQRRDLPEVRDLDKWTSKKEVADAVVSISGVEDKSVDVVSLRKPFGGAQAALVLVAPRSSRLFLNAGRFCVGKVSCRVPACDKVRCFRCLSFGPMAKS